MGVDIKFPIGLMFSILGFMLSLYGLFTNGNDVLYSRSLGVNINLWCGSGHARFWIDYANFGMDSEKESRLKC